MRDECSREPVPFAGWVQYSDDTVMMKYNAEEVKEAVINIAEQLTKHDPVNHPKHYTSHPSGVECIQITRHMGYNLGNVFKYVWRADLKGKDIEDLEKAVFYLKDEIELRKKQRQEELSERTGF
jgi:hypothetical protein